MKKQIRFNNITLLITLFLLCIIALVNDIVLAKSINPNVYIYQNFKNSIIFVIILLSLIATFILYIATKKAIALIPLFVVSLISSIIYGNLISSPLFIKNYFILFIFNIIILNLPLVFLFLSFYFKNFRKNCLIISLIVIIIFFLRVGSYAVIFQYMLYFYLMILFTAWEINYDNFEKTQKFEKETHVTSDVNYFNKLKELYALKTDGVITEEEFALKKSELLNKI